jgi:hypothetical protein
MSGITIKEAVKLLALSSVIASSFIIPGLPLSIHYLAKAWRKYSKGDVAKIIEVLYKKNLLSFKEKENGEVEIRLSEKGNDRILQYNFWDLKLKRTIDRKIRIVIFDIPNKSKKARDVFRRKLKELGFSMIQESVFATPFP